MNATERYLRAYMRSVLSRKMDHARRAGRLARALSPADYARAKTLIHRFNTTLGDAK